MCWARTLEVKSSFVNTLLSTYCRLQIVAREGEGVSPILIQQPALWGAV